MPPGVGSQAKHGEDGEETGKVRPSDEPIRDIHEPLPGHLDERAAPVHGQGPLDIRLKFRRRVREAGERREERLEA
ncbi:hypothetical protein D3C86_2041700 [compost metagenome]